MADSPWITDVTSETFQQQVVERSHKVPVVLDFWAPRCPPCRVLGPKLEALATEYAGRFLLAKVNTDENPDLASGFEIENIPTVFGIRDAKLADRFVGLISDDQLREFLDRLTGPITPSPAQKALELEGSDPAAAQAAYRDMLAAEPESPAARVGLARLLLASPGHEAEAAGLLGPVDSGDDADEAARLRTVIRLREVPHADADLARAKSAIAAGHGNAEAHLGLGRVLAARGEYIPALDALLAAAEEDKKLGGTAVREVMVDVFTVIGARSPEADEYRRKLQNILY